MDKTGDSGSEINYKKSLINRKLSELFREVNTGSQIIHNFLIWYGEMEHQKWNGKDKKKS